MSDEKWLQYALYLLNIKMRTAFEIDKKLEQKQVEETLRRSIVEKLKSEGFLNDEYYAELYIESNTSKYGAYRIKQALRAKGISDEVIEEVFERLSDNVDPIEEAKKILSKKLRTISFDKEKIKSDYLYRKKISNKLMQFLAYRGFSLDVIKKALSEVISDEFFDE